MRKELYEPYRALQNQGVNVHKERIPRMNAGGKSETVKHHTIKNLIAYAGARDYGYMSDIEVEVPQGDIDCLLWGLNDRLTLACEVETAPTEETKESKLERYVKQIGPIDDMRLINVNNVPTDMMEAADYVSNQL